jgi:hypothetical protein
MSLDVANDPLPPHRKLEDTAAGCRSLANDDRIRAQESDSSQMRFRLSCSAEAWTARAELLGRMEAHRVKMNDEPPPEALEGRNDIG